MARDQVSGSGCLCQAEKGGLHLKQQGICRAAELEGDIFHVPSLKLT